MQRKTILLKLSGELVACGKIRNSTYCTPTFIADLMMQCKKVAAQHRLAIVIGAGNLFRGASDGKKLSLDASTAHEIGMLATIMNGRILQSWMEDAGIATTLLSMVPCPTIADELRQQSITQAQKEQRVIIFVGGSGNPFFTTDTTAVIRSLQTNADELWKATKVKGLFDKDPAHHDDATYIPHATYETVLNNNYGVMDKTAITLAEQHKLPIRIMPLFTQDALVHAAQDPTFGSTIAIKE